MALDRWVALVLLGICLTYGYTAWFMMDGALPPIMKRLAVWPSSFPKVLSIAGIILSLIVVLGIEKGEVKVGDIDYRRLHEHKLGQALALLGLMVAYAILLRPAGFLLATSGFLIGGSVILGERRWIVMIVVSAIATFGIWYLVQEVLGIFLRPLPFFMGT
ncbi:MAG: tripartite tricarboxylate transporter TctB family protein [Rhodobacteraceae bacterium]|jgi:putative tricarboxylic transport membrane protein|nr:tripartite tricarboxylate transporter TctB family protein [Paracoccaceae bacterium]NCV29530.1 tripartite tricarboxylate transporter TctB family protein [Paracoccaceae bacterium]NCV66448.1 tripartite tricarboxylate transporter TctB family protein [Paracoccaceae bacterium]NCW03054.1 tripartite tricarboxylate transporter TctB family protein [Paracoccaceae bacterium]NCW60090.1 tripartite tricarboxylate transporter TctB family protein [Paracoccaceae bacterium]